MKTKSLNKKLWLQKQTITGLNPGDMDQLKGGATGYPCATYTCTPTKCFC